MSEHAKVAVAEILVQPALNGVYRLTHPVDGLLPVLDGRLMIDKQELLLALGRALDFPDYYGANWDALEECLHDMSWRGGPSSLLIEHADAIPAEQLATLIEIFLQAGSDWAEEKKVFSLFLTGLERSDLPLAA